MIVYLTGYVYHILVRIVSQTLVSCINTCMNYMSYFFSPQVVPYIIGLGSGRSRYP